jgi:hypothetical protein
MLILEIAIGIVLAWVIINKTQDVLSVLAIIGFLVALSVPAYFLGSFICEKLGYDLDLRGFSFGKGIIHTFIGLMIITYSYWILYFVLVAIRSLFNSQSINNAINKFKNKH